MLSKETYKADDLKGINGNPKEGLPPIGCCSRQNSSRRAGAILDSILIQGARPGCPRSQEALGLDFAGLVDAFSRFGHAMRHSMLEASNINKTLAGVGQIAFQPFTARGRIATKWSRRFLGNRPARQALSKSILGGLGSILGSLVARAKATLARTGSFKGRSPLKCKLPYIPVEDVWKTHGRRLEDAIKTVADVEDV